MVLNFVRVVSDISLLFTTEITDTVCSPRRVAGNYCVITRSCTEPVQILYDDITNYSQLIYT